MKEESERQRTEFTKILEERSKIEKERKTKEADSQNKSWMNKVFGFTRKMAPDDIPEIDIKGQRHRRQDSATMPKTQIERQLYRIGKYRNQLQSYEVKANSIIKYTNNSSWITNSLLSFILYLLNISIYLFYITNN